MKLDIFTNNNFKVRVALIDGKPYFVAKDVADTLGYKEPSRAVREHCKKGGAKYTPLETDGGEQKVRIIGEADLYRLIMRSNLPEAEKFQDWVVEEVLPSIRKHGAYMTEEKLEEVLSDPDKFLDLALKLREERDKAVKEKAWIGSKREATAMATASVATRKAKKLEVMLDESIEWATVKRVEIATGGKFKWQKLKKISKTLGIAPRKVFDPNFGEVNSYHSSVWLEVGIDLQGLGAQK